MFCAISLGCDRRLIFSTVRPFLELTKPGRESNYYIFGADIKWRALRFDTRLSIRRRKLKLRKL